MNILIDASNIVPHSGGFIHLKELLINSKIEKNDTIYVLASSQVINNLKFKKKKIKLISNFFLNNGIILRFIWQIIFLKKFIKKNYCQKLFVLGGYFFYKGDAKVILLIQNILPFEKQIFLKEKFNIVIKNYLLSFLYYSSISRSDGVILLSKYSKKFLANNKVPYKVIPHGLNKIFKKKIKIRNKIKKDFKILYVSKYEIYKNHLKLVEACHYLKKKNFNISLTLVGINLKKNSKLYDYINSLNLEFKNFIKVENFKKQSHIINYYSKFDLQVYASKCEAFGLIILETIASSLPIICSNYPVYKEILNIKNIYFNPDDKKDIAKKIKFYFENPKIKFKNTNKLFEHSKKFNWDDVCKKTFNFIKEIN